MQRCADAKDVVGSTKKGFCLQTQPIRAWLWKGLLSFSLLLVGLLAPFSTAFALSNPVWGGYVAEGNTAYQSAQMSWVVPCITTGIGSPGKTAVWVGVGGWIGSNRRVVQAGTTSEAFLIGTKYYAWVEDTGTENTPAITEFSVNCGDQMYSSISNGNTAYIQDITTGTSQTKTFANPADTNTAECIVERPGVPLAAFQTITITNCSVGPSSGVDQSPAGGDLNAGAMQSIGNDTYEQVTLVGDNGTPLVNIGPLDGSGGFTVTWQASS
jgi:hypothetical protein